jgi:hypothetical protein
VSHLFNSWQILKELHKSCQKEDGSDDQKKGTQLLEVYAIEIQMYTEMKNNKKLKVKLPFASDYSIPVSDACFFCILLLCSVFST